MDVCESEKAPKKQSTAKTTRQPLISADNKNGTTCRSRARDVSSRYRSPMPSSASGPKRCPSPNASRKSSTSTVSAPRRAVSAERKCPSTPSLLPSPSPSTPIQYTTAEMLLATRKTVNVKLEESLWSSAMRSLSISFQSATISVPNGKREKTLSHMSADLTLRASSNVACKGETPSSKKPKPERKGSPVNRKNSADQLQNFKPVDSLNARLLDQHRWPSRTSGKMSTALNRNDINDKMDKTSSLSHSRMGKRYSRRLSLDGAIKPLEKSASDLLTLIRRDDAYGSSVDDGSLRIQGPCSSSSSDRISLVNTTNRAQSLPISGSSLPSPLVSRGVSPSPSKATNPSSRRISPARIRPSSPSRQLQNSTSVLSFIADIKKGKKSAKVEDVHQLRLSYNRHLQWRFANARADAALRSQKVKAEKMLYSMWRIIVDLWDLVREKRSDLQQLRLKLKLSSILNNQMTCLDGWASIERDHLDSLTWAIKDLQESTVCIPVTGGARGDTNTVKAALCSAVHVVQAMGSSLCSTLSKVEEMHCLISELADVAAHERAMLDECESLLGSIAALKVEESYLRTLLSQIRRGWRNGRILP